MQLTLRFFQKKPSAFHLTIYQTPEYGAASGHQPVYRTKIGGRTLGCLEKHSRHLMYMIQSNDYMHVL
ncbi:hypothetical protein R0I01_03540 [Bacillus pumilus]|nr:hypothetical protein R0I01_03540 [Bacillus pumilus]